MAFTFSGFATNGSFNLVCPNPPPPPPVYMWAWGYGNGGQLGDGTTITKSSPVQIGSLTTWASIASGAGANYALKTDGTLWAWGSNNAGGLGQGNTTDRSSPVQIGALTTWAKVDASGWNNYAKAIKTDGTLWAWGNNSYGYLGDGTNINKSSPIQIGALTDWTTTIAAGASHTLAIKTDGTLWTWGLNYYGRLGLGNTTNRSSPVQIGSLTNWLKVSAGYDFSAAIKTDGTLWLWGRGVAGKLGLGNVTNYSSPKQVGSLTNWSNIVIGQNHSAAIKTNGTLWTWGYTGKGQLGQGDTIDKYSPVQVGALTDWSILCQDSFDSMAAIKTDGTLWTWGWNLFATLGLGDTTDRFSTVQVGASTNWQSVSSYYSTLALG